MKKYLIDYKNKNKIIHRENLQENNKVKKSHIYKRYKKKNKKTNKDKKKIPYIDYMNNSSFKLNPSNKNSNKKIKLYNDYELNELEYDNALKIDKRTFFQLYISLLKSRHILLFSFFQLNDYNSYMIKIYLFFLTFSINYIISAMFYSDSTMHQIYIDDGSFNLAYQLPQMFYSFIGSTILENLLNLLGLYEGNIVEIKTNIIRKKKIRKALMCIKMKIALFFIISYILSFLFWIYLGCFCAVYKNTQIHLFLEVTSSFSLSFITPFFTNIMPCIFRILSLRDKKGKQKYLFKFSNFLQNI